METVMRLGRRMQILVIVLAILIPAAFVYVLSSNGAMALLQVPPNVHLDATRLSLGDRLLIGLVAAPRPIVYLICLWFLYRLFGLYRRGVVFDREATGWLKRTGWALIAIDVIAWIQGLVAGPVLTLAGITRPSLWIQAQSSFLIIGLFVIVIAHVMEIARSMQEEQRLTI